MKTIIQLLNKKQFTLLLFTLLVPLVTFAEALTPKEVAAKEAANEAKWALVGEIAIGIFFVAAVTAFLIYKTKHEKKERAKQVEIMKKVQANRPTSRPTGRRRPR